MFFTLCRINLLYEQNSKSLFSTKEVVISVLFLNKIFYLKKSKFYEDFQKLCLYMLCL